MLACLVDSEEHHAAMWRACRGLLIEAAGRAEQEAVRRPALWSLVHLSSTVEAGRQFGIE